MTLSLNPAFGLWIHSPGIRESGLGCCSAFDKFLRTRSELYDVGSAILCPETSLIHFEKRSVFVSKTETTVDRPPAQQPAVATPQVGALERARRGEGEARGRLGCK